MSPKKPKLPEPATPEGDEEAERKATEEATRRARAAASGAGSSRQSLLTGGPLTTQRKTLLGG